MNPTKLSPLTTVVVLAFLLFNGCSQIKKANSDFVYDKNEFPGPKPWTSENFLNTPDNFQFAILGDRGGGASPLGTYELAIQQLNWLQPEFVMSVGDYVEGYATDEEDMDEQWNEFEEIIAKLEPPFFYVRGNHDINMPLTRKAWAERRGPQYYYFIYKDVLFIILDTEDAERPMPPNMEQDIATFNRLNKEDPQKAMAFMIEWMKTPEAQEAFGHSAKVEFPEAQQAWLKKVLEDNKDVRWTFLFLHEPVWDNPSESFQNMDQMLQDRDFTFFAGHTHYYDYDLINGHEYITVSSAGAAFTMDGPGNVDMLTWVTVKDDGPDIAGIALKGIFDRKGLDPAMFGAYDRAPRIGPDMSKNDAEGHNLGIESVPNFRDLGGYENIDGKTIKKNLLYRANQLSGITEEDMQKIAGLNLKNVFDLRTDPERSSRPDELPSDVNLVVLDVLADAENANPAILEQLMKNPQKANEELGGGKAEAGFIESYKQFITLPSAQKAFGELYLTISDKDQLPAVFHCTTGKDRTGWAAAALLTLLEVPHDVVMEDYLQSNEFILAKYKNVIDAFVNAGGDKKIPEAILGVKKEYLEAAFSEMRKNYGTIEKYFSEGLGIDAEHQKALKDNFLGPQMN